MVALLVEIPGVPELVSPPLHPHACCGPDVAGYRPERSGKSLGKRVEARRGHDGEPSNALTPPGELVHASKRKLHCSMIVGSEKALILQGRKRVPGLNRGSGPTRWMFGSKPMAPGGDVGSEGHD